MVFLTLSNFFSPVFLHSSQRITLFKLKPLISLYIYSVFIASFICQECSYYGSFFWPCNFLAQMCFHCVFERVSTNKIRFLLTLNSMRSLSNFCNEVLIICCVDLGGFRICMRAVFTLQFPWFCAWSTSKVLATLKTHLRIIKTAGKMKCSKCSFQ